MRRARIERFEAQMVAALRREFPSRWLGMPEDSLLALVRRGIRQAERYGFSSVRAVERWIRYVVRFPREFDEGGDQPRWLSAILSDRDSSDARRMDRIDNYVALLLQPAGEGEP